MARKSTTKTPENTTQAIADALDTPLNLEWDTTAESLNISIPELQERMAAKLDETVFTWANIPAEHQPVVDAIARDLEIERSVRRLPPVQPQAQEPPILVEEEPQPLKKGGKLTKTKAQSTGITQKRKKSIQKQVETIENVELAINEQEKDELIQDAASDGIEIGQAQVLAREAGRITVLKEARKRTVKRLGNKAKNRSDYDPIAVLERNGIEVPEEIQEDLAEFTALTAGKLGKVHVEIRDNCWTNGYSDDFTELDELLNSPW
jgi:hypothetical protein